MVRCVNCGGENPNDAEFCNKCGSRMDATGRHAPYKRARDECFGLPRGGSIFALFIGSIIILWGISEAFGIDIPIWGYVVIIFGILVIAGGIYGLTHERRY